MPGHERRLPIAELAREDDDGQDVVRRGLDWLCAVAPYDLATLFELEGERLLARWCGRRAAPSSTRVTGRAANATPTRRSPGSRSPVGS